MYHSIIIKMSDVDWVNAGRSEYVETVEYIFKKDQCKKLVLNNLFIAIENQVCIFKNISSSSNYILKKLKFKKILCVSKIFLRFRPF